MQPRGLGIPAILAAVFAGPCGNSSYSSLMVTPDVLPRALTVGPVPFAAYSERMKWMTSQCRSVSSSMPSARASSTAIVSFQSCGFSKKPSSLMATVVPSRVAVGMVFAPRCSVSVGCDRVPQVLARDRHVGRDAGDVTAWEQDVPVEPLEHQLAEVVEARLLEERR